MEVRGLLGGGRENPGSGRSGDTRSSCAGWERSEGVGSEKHCLKRKACSVHAVRAAGRQAKAGET